MDYNVSSVIWVLVATALIYFMQAGFALCEAGLTRAKNTEQVPKTLCCQVCVTLALKTQTIALIDQIMMSDCMIRLHTAPHTRSTLIQSCGSTLHSEASRGVCFPFLLRGSGL